MHADETRAASGALSHGTDASPAKAKSSWKAWFRPAGKAIAAVAVVAGLTWMGARASASPAPIAPSVSAAVVAASPASAGERVEAAATPSAARTSRGLLADGRVVLNVADETELCQLPRVGPAKAKRIIALREKLGHFRSLRDLLRVKGIGARTLQQMMPKLVLDDPEGGAKGGS